MIGTILKIVKGEIGPEAIELAWGREFISMPLAPGEGLILKMCHYKQYNKKHPHKAIELSESDENMIRAFKQDEVLPTVLQSLVIFKQWWNEDSGTILPPQETQAPQPVPAPVPVQEAVESIASENVSEPVSEVTAQVATIQDSVPEERDVEVPSKD
jgi:hypothetical protein